MIDFDALVSQTLATNQRHCFLVAFLQTKPAPGVFPEAAGRGSFVRIAATGIEIVAVGLDFNLFLEHSRDIKWDLAAITKANNRDGSPPAIDDCKRWLEDMERRIANGDMRGMAVFGRDGMVLEAVSSQVITAPPPGTPLQ